MSRGAPPYPYNRDELEPERLAALAALYDRQTLAWLLPHIKLGDSVLELGVGDGDVAKAVVDKLEPGGQFTGIELNEARVKAASSKLGKGVSLIQADAVTAVASLVAERSESFDVIYCRWFLWVLPNEALMPLLKSLFLLLRPGGKLLIEEANMMAMGSEPECAAVTTHRENVRTRNEKMGTPMDLGPRMAGLLAEACPDATVSVVGVHQPAATTEEAKKLMWYGAMSAQQAYLNAGIEPAALKAVIDGLEVAAKDPGITLKTTENTMTMAVKPGGAGK